MANKRQKAISLDGDVIQTIQRIADSKGRSWSYIAAGLIDLGLSKRDWVEELAAALNENERLLARLAARG